MTTKKTTAANPLRAQRVGMRREQPKPKQETAWAIYSGEMLLPFTVRVTRTESLREIERCYGWPWRTCKKRGCSVAKVRVQPVGKAHTSELDATVAPYKAQSFRLFRLVSL